MLIAQHCNVIDAHVFVNQNTFLLIHLPAVVTGRSKSNHHTRYHTTCICLFRITMPSKRSEAPKKVVSRSKNTLVYIQYIMGCGHWAWLRLAKYAENDIY